MNEVRIIHLKSLHPHHRRLMLYGAVQAGVALLSAAFLWPGQARVTLTLPDGLVLSNPTWVVVAVPFLMMNALVYSCAAAIRSVFWLRLLVASAVSLTLLFLGSSLGSIDYVMFPALGLAGYVIWRGFHCLPHHPGYRDIVITGALVVTGWGLAIVFGMRTGSTGILGTVYLGILQFVTLMGILPGFLLLLAGIDLAELFENLADRLSAGLGRWGRQTALLSLLVLSLAKLGFYGWNGLPPLDSSLLASVLFLLLVGWIVKRTPRHLFEFEPRFQHFLTLAALALLIPFSASIALLISRSLFHNFDAGPLAVAAPGPVWLACAAVLSLRKSTRPFAMFAALAGCWVALSLGLGPMVQEIAGRTWPGIQLRDLDFLTACCFLFWSLHVFIKGKSADRARLFLKITLFMNGGFLLDQLLSHHIAVAEWYGVFQSLAFFAAHYLSSKKGRTGMGLIILGLAAVLVVFSHWHAPFGERFVPLLENGVIACAITWDLLVSEYRMGGTEGKSVTERTARLFLYLGFTTWAAAQFLFARTGEHAGALLLEPLLNFGFIALGLPAMFFMFIREFLNPQGEDPSSLKEECTAAPEEAPDTSPGVSRPPVPETSGT